ncbi:MAG: undecaprenyldiphospho-muramoylpentapeptide beta-N-acetylglucosaminyltransferase [Thauera propionica]|jgi:UDP-N-acetylglucosamine--N-acetylmuramyl-(pentapeptide) pyrophosphoryl-undecaprenol N-acetylglucosamine transferase|uniref:UDP-N-acetylglucosamine--N-acetylmuramyl-(pentapeptide) pyrophosphoryl-undecaprenol N-acetylglucosamine transferase n=1 Tax=Thauera propionica TaxID=2019431 RepID=A0A235F209_9RHOO|nr:MULTISPECIES: undecaprenyldiphospho-muramoylpentapeptide beta-N-acetylglucosaminyltransferase [Thauera]MDD3676475.1 undecaprenyldiphospho-muramoylpentapeptide beta-N-acetylglucosaminyltransferase [Thauera propionica]MDI3489833.1 UDP-N-acetylglucosamine--N-acetylmuramyl-(pentapeptide) pyrophosphoryl-undecaprenol [Thauera sp.]MDY0046991.1 undecaprenyldiphospho-muramoylpentapeptide beta-N-acetylglucosaminyltransferase [Thauera propionica]OYD54907.1 undecaprenyldiphospho-muramoylpentapeptide bet
MKTLMVMAGGTGGHIFPGIAVAEALRAKGWRVVWMGNPDGMEARIVPARGYETAWVRFGALRGKGLVRKLMLPVNLLSGFWQALRALRSARPDVVVGMGGYITFPGGMMAALLGRPLVLHEQNSVAGLANRVLARVADRVLTGFPQVLAKSSWVGNPVRAEIAAVAPPAERFAGREGPLRILVVGGSLGAAALNEAVPAALGRMPADQRPLVVHQAGEKQIDALRTAYARARVDGDLRPFIDDMASAYAEADLVICRAGALTVAELAAVGVASLLVPFPHAVDDHQTGNARFLAEHGGAYLLPQTELNAERLAGILASIDRPRLLQMAEHARALARPLAAAEVARVCEELAGGDRT